MKQCITCRVRNTNAPSEAAPSSPRTPRFSLRYSVLITHPWGGCTVGVRPRWTVGNYLWWSTSPCCAYVRRVATDKNKYSQLSSNCIHTDTSSITPEICGGCQRTRRKVSGSLAEGDASVTVCSSRQSPTANNTNPESKRDGISGNWRV